MDEARRRVEIILDAYGSDATWGDVLRLAIIRLHDLASMSIEKAEELGKPELLDDAKEYDRDARCLRELADAG
jgi:hypothetical protein